MLSESDFKKEYKYDALNPLMQQYLDLKFDHQDCLVLFRLGDFYELFFEDAKKASKLLNIVLTSRDKGTIGVPMCGIPYHALENYLSKLVSNGYNVAICEQMESPLEAKNETSS